MNYVYKYTYTFDSKNFALINIRTWNDIWSLKIGNLFANYKFFDRDDDIELVPINIEYQLEDDKQIKNFNCGYLIFINDNPKYYSYYSSLESNDGEYIPELVKYNLNIKVDFDKIKLVDTILENNIKISALTDNNKYKDFIIENKLDIILFGLSISNFYYSKSNSIMIYNINRNYEEFMESIYESDSKNKIIDFKNLYKTSSKIENKKLSQNFITGFKIIPLYEIEATSISLILRVWQEKLALITMTEQLMNMCCRNFPSYYGDTYLYDLNTKFFQSNMYHIKKIRSDKIVQLKEKIDNLIPDDPEFLDIKLQTLKNLVDFTKSAMTLSNVSCCIAQEHVGAIAYDMLPGMLAGHFDYTDMRNLLFDWTYSIYIMTLQKILHTDLTLSNVTYINRSYQIEYRNCNLTMFCIPSLFDAPATIKRRLESLDFHTIYNKLMSGERYTPVTPNNDDEYILPDFGLSGGIIDFSRAVVFNTVNDDTDMFPFRQNYTEYYYNYIISQIQRIYKLESDQVKEEIKDTLRHIPLAVFNALITYDLIIFTESFLSWEIWTDKKSKIKAWRNRVEFNPLIDKDLRDIDGQTLSEHYAPCRKIIEQLNELAWSTFKIRMRLLLDKQYMDLVALPNPMPFIIKQVFHKIFGNKIPDVKKYARYDQRYHKPDPQITEVYSPNNPQIFSYNNLNLDSRSVGAEIGKPYGVRDPKGVPFLKN